MERMRDQRPASGRPSPRNGPRDRCSPASCRARDERRLASFDRRGSHRGCGGGFRRIDKSACPRAPRPRPRRAGGPPHRRAGGRRVRHRVEIAGDEHRLGGIAPGDPPQDQAGRVLLRQVGEVEVEIVDAEGACGPTIAKPDPGTDPLRSQEDAYRRRVGRLLEPERAPAELLRIDRRRRRSRNARRPTGRRRGRHRPDGAAEASPRSIESAHRGLPARRGCRASSRRGRTGWHPSGRASRVDARMAHPRRRPGCSRLRPGSRRHPPWLGASVRQVASRTRRSGRANRSGGPPARSTPTSTRPSDGKAGRSRLVRSHHAGRPGSGRPAAPPGRPRSRRKASPDVRMAGIGRTTHPRRRTAGRSLAARSSHRPRRRNRERPACGGGLSSMTGATMNRQPGESGTP